MERSSKNKNDDAFQSGITERPFSEVEMKSINRGLEDANAGKLTSHSEVRKRYAKWIK